MTGDAYTSLEIARMLGVNPVTVRKWRVKNKALGVIKYGPPYVFRGSDVVYPRVAFDAWCGAVEVVDGVPRMNLPASAIIPLPQGVNEVVDGQA